MKNTPFDLTGKVAIVTGSSRGIGRAAAELLAQLGAKVVISSRKAEACREVADAKRRTSGGASSRPAATPSSFPATSRARPRSRR